MRRKLSFDTSQHPILTSFHQIICGPRPKYKASPVHLLSLTGMTMYKVLFENYNSPVFIQNLKSAVVAHSSEPQKSFSDGLHMPSGTQRCDTGSCSGCSAHTPSNSRPYFRRHLVHSAWTRRDASFRSACRRLTKHRS